MMKVIITDCDHDNIDMETKILNTAQIDFELKQCHSEEDVISQCQDADALISSICTYYKKKLWTLYQN